MMDFQGKVISSRESKDLALSHLYIEIERLVKQLSSVAYPGADNKGQTEYKNLVTHIEYLSIVAERLDK
jgi:hypothetical protein